MPVLKSNPLKVTGLKIQSLKLYNIFISQRVSYSGNTTGFQPVAAGSIPATRSKNKIN